MYLRADLTCMDEQLTMGLPIRQYYGLLDCEGGDRRKQVTSVGVPMKETEKEKERGEKWETGESTENVSGSRPEGCSGSQLDVLHAPLATGSSC